MLIRTASTIRSANSTRVRARAGGSYVYDVSNPVRPVEILPLGVDGEGIEHRLGSRCRRVDGPGIGGRAIVGRLHVDGGPGRARRFEGARQGAFQVDLAQAGGPVEEGVTVGLPCFPLGAENL